MTPLVSVIVPVYKVPEKYLRQCIKSIQDQTLKELEIILVDDGSPDECGKICDEYAENDKRIKVVHQGNKGLSGARNAGVRAAISEWITMVDGDDWIEEDCLEQAYNKAVENNVEIVIWGSVKDFNGRLNPYRYDNNFTDGKVYCGTECKYLREMLLHYNGQIATAYAKLIKKSYIEKYDLYHDEILRQGAEGLEFCMRLFEKAERILFLNKHLYHYIYNENSISAISSEKNNQYVINCFRAIKEQIDVDEDREKLSSWFYNRLKYVIVSTAISGYFHPKNKKPYKERKELFKQFLKIDIIKESLKNHNNSDLSKQRRLILFFIKTHMFSFLELLGKMRYKSKLRKCN